MTDYLFDQNDSPFPTEIETKRLKLKPLSFDNFSAYEIHETFNNKENPETWEYIDLPPANNIQDTIQIIERAEEKWSEMVTAYYIVIEKQSGHLIGFSTLEHTDFDKEKTEIGVWFNKDYWGNEYCKEISTALTEVAIEKMGLQVVEAHIADGNQKSINAFEKVMKQIGGEKAGVIQNEYLIHEEDPVDMHIYSVNAEQYYDSKTTSPDTESE